MTQSQETQSSKCNDNKKQQKRERPLTKIDDRYYQPKPVPVQVQAQAQVFIKSQATKTGKKNWLFVGFMRVSERLERTRSGDPML